MELIENAILSISLHAKLEATAKLLQDYLSAGFVKSGVSSLQPAMR
jgi:hypothetical protein